MTTLEFILVGARYEMNVPFGATPVWRYLHNRKSQVSMDIIERIQLAQKVQKDFCCTETPPQTEKQAHRPPMTSYELLFSLPSSPGVIAHQGAPCSLWPWCMDRLAM